MAQSRAVMPSRINSGGSDMSEDGIMQSQHANGNINKSQEQQEYIPVDEMYDVPDAGPVPHDQKQLVPMNQPRRVPSRGPPPYGGQRPMGPPMRAGPPGGPPRGQMMMYQGPGPNGQNMQLVPMQQMGGQLVPFEQKEKKKKFSLTDFEDKRRKTCAGRMCVNTLYFLCTLLMIIVFIAIITDVISYQNQEIQKKEQEIARAKQEYNDWCHPITPYNKADCETADNLRNQSASDMVSFGSSFSKYLASSIGDFADGLAWKTIGVIALLFCICACGSSCAKFMKNVASDPTQFQRAANEKRRRAEEEREREREREREKDKKKKKKKKDSSDSSSDDESKKKWKKKYKAIKYGHPYHDGHQGPPPAIGYGNEYYGGRQGPQYNYNALPQYEGQGMPGGPRGQPLAIDSQPHRGGPPPRNAPLMIGNGPQGQGRGPMPGPQGAMMRMTKETTQQVQGANGQMIVKKTQQVVEQNIDTSQHHYHEDQGPPLDLYDKSEIHDEEKYEQQEAQVADKTYDVTVTVDEKHENYQ